MSIRHNFHKETEACMNTLIKMELTSSYAYISMMAHYDRDDVALLGFHKFLLDMSEKKREDADKLMKKQTERGGRVVFQDLQANSESSWGRGADGLTAALAAEMASNEEFIKFHSLAETHEDKHTMDWVQSEFLTPRVELIKKLGDMKRQLSRAGDGLGEHTVDRELAK